jgi:tRNA threonylcarbamoyladenosine biosynthesis protein TsaB
MLIISIDTSGKSGGIALAEGDSSSFRVLGSSPIAGGTFSAQLVPTLSSLLQKHRLTPQDIAGFVAASGPGSFTGLRVGLAAIKGLAEILKKPIATVSLLEALAISSGHNGKTMSVLDAGRGEVFLGLYDVDGELAVKVQEELLPRAELLNITRQSNRPVQLVTSDQSIFDFIEFSGMKIKSVARPGSEHIARIGLHKLLLGQTVSVAELDANYVRRSDAEIFSSGHRVTGSSGQRKTKD